MTTDAGSRPAVPPPGAEAAPPGALPPQAQMLNMITLGRMTSHALGVAARLDLATIVADGALAADELARLTGCSADALHRMLRALASVGVFEEVDAGRFRNTPLSATLRSDAPASARPLALFFGHDVHIQAWLGLDHSVRTGDSGFTHVHGAPPFEYVATHPEVAQVFDAAMTAFSATLGPAIVEAYDFAGIDEVVDVGGGQGQLLCTLLARHPAMRGVLFDLPHVVAGADAVIGPTGLGDRITIQGGDFFEAVPAASTYLAKTVLHDWADDAARRILTNIHRAARPGARLLIVEAILRAGNAPDLAKFMDLEMLVTGGGRERDAAEWGALLGATGFSLERIIPTRSPVCILEATRLA